MLRLIFSDLLDNVRVWLGVLLVTAATAVVGAVVACDIETGLVTGGNVALALYGISSTMIVFSVAAALVVLGSVTALAVTLHQRAYALWQLVGLRPAHVRTVVHAQLATLAFTGGTAGCFLAAPVLRPLFRFSFATSPDFSSLRPSFGFVSAAAVVVFVVLLAVAASARGARRAAHTPVIRTLREADAPPVTMSRKRWVAAGAMVAVLVWLVSTLPGTDPGRMSAPLMLVGPLVAGIFTALGPLFMAALVRGWTALIPESRSSAWYLARNASVSHLGRSTAVINPLLLAIALAGGLYAAGDAAHGATGDPGPMPVGAVVLLLGGPVLLSLLGATATLFMASRSREREVALVVAGGGSPATVTAAAAAEAVIYVGTACLLGIAAVATTLLAAAWGTGQGLAVSAATTTAVAVLTAGGALLIVPATVIPALLALRQDVPRALAAE
ncbi:FtsX-like permease family protein [Amycolatopsis sp. NPDC051045]|uniref:FtsX-like permease family protein n=1 Tax=Amycolatopsis sp. NPDC051045 TaxID=3156922 RepID=UPI003433BBE7